MDDPVVNAIAKETGKTPAQILIRFSLERGLICIPKSVTPSRIESNFEVGENVTTHINLKLKKDGDWGDTDPNLHLLEMGLICMLY